jgi:hypothetical protein
MKTDPRYNVILALLTPIATKPVSLISVLVKVKIQGSIMSVGKMSPEDTPYRLVITKKTFAGIGTLSRQLVVIIYSELIIVHIFFIAPPTTTWQKKLPITVSWLSYSNQSPAFLTFL